MATDRNEALWDSSAAIKQWDRLDVESSNALLSHDEEDDYGEWMRKLLVISCVPIFSRCHAEIYHDCICVPYLAFLHKLFRQRLHSFTEWLR